MKTSSADICKGRLPLDLSILLATDSLQKQIELKKMKLP